VLVRAILVVLVVAYGSARADVQIERSGLCALDALQARVTALVGTPTATGVIYVRTNRADTLRAEIEVAGGDAPMRVITGTDCDALVDPVAVVVALLVRTLPPPAPPPVPPPPVPPARPPVAAPSTTLAVEAGGGATLDADPVLLLGGRVARGLGAIGIELAVAPPVEHAITMGHVRVSTGRLTLAPCVERWSLAACGLVSVGWVHGRGSNGNTATRPATAVGARLEWRPMFAARIGVRVFAETRYFANRVAFLVDDVPVWRSTAVETVVGIGGFVRFP
jgi:hypothetical protein